MPQRCVFKPLRLSTPSPSTENKESSASVSLSMTLSWQDRPLCFSLTPRGDRQGLFNTCVCLSQVLAVTRHLEPRPGLGSAFIGVQGGLWLKH